MSDDNREKLASMTVADALEKIEKNGQESLAILRMIESNGKPSSFIRATKATMPLQEGKSAAPVVANINTGALALQPQAPVKMHYAPALDSQPRTIREKTASVPISSNPNEILPPAVIEKTFNNALSERRSSKVLTTSGTVPANSQGTTLRDGSGRFLPSTSPLAVPRTNDEQSGKTLLEILKGGASGTWKDKKGDVQDIAGRAALGPMWDVGMQIKEAVQSTKEKSSQGTAGELRAWGVSKFGKKPTADKETKAHVKAQAKHDKLEAESDKAELKHDQLTAKADKAKLRVKTDAAGGTTVINNGGADGSGGMFGIFAGSLLGRALAPLAGVIGPVVSGMMALAGPIALFAAGLIGLKWLIDKGQANQRPLKPGDTNAINPVAPSDAAKMRWRSAIYQPVVDNASKKYGVDSNLTNAVIQTESEFNPNAKSKSGAGGLMQLMPETAKQLGVTNVYDPAQNVDAGVQHLSRLQKKYNGNETNFLQAYNWGEGNMDSYLKTGKGVKGQDMPRETQEYAQKVLQYKAALAGTQTGAPAAPYTAKPGTPEYTAMQAKFMADEQTSQEGSNPSQSASQGSNSPSVTSTSNVEESAPARSIKKEETLPTEEAKTEIITEAKRRRSRPVIQAAISSEPVQQEAKTAITQGIPEYKRPPEPKPIRQEPPPNIEQIVAAVVQKQQSQAAQQSNQQNNSDKDRAPVFPYIPTEFSDVQLTLMAYDRT